MWINHLVGMCLVIVLYILSLILHRFDDIHFPRIGLMILLSVSLKILVWQFDRRPTQRKNISAQSANLHCTSQSQIIWLNE